MVMSFENSYNITTKQTGVFINILKIPFSTISQLHTEDISDFRYYSLLCHNTSPPALGQKPTPTPPRRFVWLIFKFLVFYNDRPIQVGDSRSGGISTHFFHKTLPVAKLQVKLLTPLLVSFGMHVFKSLPTPSITNFIYIRFNILF